MQKKRADCRMHYGARSAYGTDCMESKPQETGTLHRYETCSLLVSCMANSFRTMFMLQSKTGMPPRPPDTPLDECFFPMPSPELSTCLLQGCGKMVKRMWNHLDYHKKRGTYCPNNCTTRRGADGVQRLLLHATLATAISGVLLSSTRRTVCWATCNTSDVHTYILPILQMWDTFIFQWPKRYVLRVSLRKQ